MIEKGKISAFQMAVIMYPTIQATAILLVPAITATTAERDMWISPIWASLAGFLTVYIAYRLHKLYPKETIIEYSERILGRIPGKALGLVYILFYLHNTAFVIREYGEFVVGTFLPHTPLVVIIGSMMLVCSFNIRGGLEVMGRSAQIFIPIVLVLFLGMVILVIPTGLEPANMLPVMEHGVAPSIRGAVVPQGWFCEFILIAFLLPYLSDRHKGMRWAMISTFAVMLTMVITNLASLFLLGGIVSKLTYPVMIVARYISIADFFEHLESIVMAIWVAGTFIKISMFSYALMLGTAQWLKLSSYRPIALPIGFLLVAVAVWVAPNLQVLIHFFDTTSPFYSVLIQAVVPLMLLLVAHIRNKPRPIEGG